MPQAARVADPTSHGPPLAPGPGSLDVMIGFMPAWRALPAGVGAGIESASNAMQTLMSSPALTPADATANLAQAQAGMSQAAAAAAAEGNAGAPATTTSAFTTLQTTNVTLTTAYTTASAAPGGQPAATVAYTEGIKAAAAAAASAAMSAIAGMTDMHVCPIPVPIPPHGPGVVTQGSKSVLINNLPAARQNDKVFEAAGGPDPIAMGCPTVMIGDDGGGSGGGAGGGSGTTSSFTSEVANTQAQRNEAAGTAEAMQAAAAHGVALVELETLDPTEEPKDELATIEFRVLSEQDGTPRAGVRMVIRGPDGKEHRCTTDSDGRIVLNNVPDGNYDIVKTESPKVYEVVRMESAPR